MGTKRSAKIMKLGKDEEHDKAVFLWFKQKREEVNECLKWLEEQEEATLLHVYFVTSEN